MRIKIDAASGSAIMLPLSYNAFLQAFIYGLLEPHAARWLHDEGFDNREKAFRLFTFSEISGRSIKEGNSFNFGREISFFISSPVDWILEQVALNAIKSTECRIGNNSLNISSISILPVKTFETNECRISAMTPIEVHTTFETKNGKKKTYYFTPFEDDFSERINDNLRNKWSAMHRKECPYTIAIRPEFKGDANRRVRGYVKNGNRFMINGWVGKYAVKSDPEFIKFAYDAGLGSGNSRGCGMFEVV